MPGIISAFLGGTSLVVPSGVSKDRSPETLNPVNSGPSAPYYYSPGGLYRFRSKVEVLYYMNHGRVMKKEDRQKRRNCGLSNAQENTQEQLLISPSPSGWNLESLRNTKRLIRSLGNHRQ
ncbi:hypothetical protein Taro_002832 [Colocasia esculenta]|uniref:Uncharacterized protein n=1 Tax=Colocasia esculenta TaxID=4460 RepID=A0A843TM22_COLES|nr:hypothetical protein [Colocasia esculenta]